MTHQCSLRAPSAARVRTNENVPAALTRPSRCSSRPSEMEGAGNAGRRCTRGLVCKKLKKTHTSWSQVQPNTSGIPRAMFDDLFRALLGVPGVLVTVARSRRLDTSIGVSGPHGFVGRILTRFVFARQRIHRIPASRFVTIAIRPSSGGGMCGDNHVFLKNGRQIFLYERLTRIRKISPTGKSLPYVTLAHRQKSPI